MKFNNLYTNETHAIILFADGEVNSTKGQDLLWSRSMHCLKLPVVSIDEVPNELLALFDTSYANVPCILLSNDDEVDAYRELLYAHIGDLDILKMLGYAAIHGYIDPNRMDYIRKDLFNVDNETFPKQVVELYQQCKSNQDSISGYLRQYSRDILKKDKASHAWIAYCRRQDSYGWWMLDNLRRLKEEFKDPSGKQRMSAKQELRLTYAKLAKEVPIGHRKRWEIDWALKDKDLRAYKLDELIKIIKEL